MHITINSSDIYECNFNFLSTRLFSLFFVFLLQLTDIFHTIFHHSMEQKQKPNRGCINYKIFYYLFICFKFMPTTIICMLLFSLYSIQQYLTLSRVSYRFCVQHSFIRKSSTDSSVSFSKSFVNFFFTKIKKYERKIQQIIFLLSWIVFFICCVPCSVCNNNLGENTQTIFYWFEKERARVHFRIICGKLNISFVLFIVIFYRTTQYRI